MHTFFIAAAECGPSNWGAGRSGTVQGADEVPEGKGPGAAEQAVLWVQWGAKWAGGGAGGGLVVVAGFGCPRTILV